MRKVHSFIAVLSIVWLALISAAETPPDTPPLQGAAGGGAVAVLNTPTPTPTPASGDCQDSSCGRP